MKLNNISERINTTVLENIMKCNMKYFTYYDFSYPDILWNTGFLFKRPSFIFKLTHIKNEIYTN